jgi:hypothetical protein
MITCIGCHTVCTALRIQVTLHGIADGRVTRQVMIGIASKMSDLLSSLSSTSPDSSPIGSPTGSRRAPLTASTDSNEKTSGHLRRYLRGFVFEGKAGIKDIHVTSQAEFEVSCRALATWLGASSLFSDVSSNPQCVSCLSRALCAVLCVASGRCS